MTVRPFVHQGNPLLLLRWGDYVSVELDKNRDNSLLQTRERSHMRKYKNTTKLSHLITRATVYTKTHTHTEETIPSV
jgi:hypothetical protein